MPKDLLKYIISPVTSLCSSLRCLLFLLLKWQSYVEFQPCWARVYITAGGWGYTTCAVWPEFNTFWWFFPVLTQPLNIITKRTDQSAFWKLLWLSNSFNWWVESSVWAEKSPNWTPNWWCAPLQWGISQYLTEPQLYGIKGLSALPYTFLFQASLFSL